MPAAGQGIGPLKNVRAMIDPGANMSVVDPQVRQSLNLTPFRVH